MPGVVWKDSEKEALKRYVSEGLTARMMKRKGYFTGNGVDGVDVNRSTMSIQKQMQRMGLVDPERSSMVKEDKAEAWRGKDRDACIADLVDHWRTTPVETFAERWGVSPATIKYLLKKRGLGLTWKEAIQLKDSPFRNPEKRKEWAETFRAKARLRREKRREELVSKAMQQLQLDSGTKRRRCHLCHNVYPLIGEFFRVTKHKGRLYFAHLCIVCSCERGSANRERGENLMVRRNRERLIELSDRLRANQKVREERICWKCFRSWPVDKRFFKYSISRATGRVLYEHVCRLCRAARRRELAHRSSGS